MVVFTALSCLYSTRICLNCSSFLDCPHHWHLLLTQSMIESMVRYYYSLNRRNSLWISVLQNGHPEILDVQMLQTTCPHGIKAISRPWLWKQIWHSKVLVDTGPFDCLHTRLCWQDLFASLFRGPVASKNVLSPPHFWYKFGHHKKRNIHPKLKKTDEWVVEDQTESGWIYKTIRFEESGLVESMEDVVCERCHFTVPKTLIQNVVIQTIHKSQICLICDLCFKDSQSEKKDFSLESALKNLSTKWIKISHDLLKINTHQQRHKHTHTRTHTHTLLFNSIEQKWKMLKSLYWYHSRWRTSFYSKFSTFILSLAYNCWHEMMRLKPLYIL